MKGKRSPGPSLFDKLLVPRIENYGSNNDITDIDAVCEYLRRNYKEYTRQKLPALRQQVERAVDAIARKGGVTKAELRLQVSKRGGAASQQRQHACAACGGRPPPLLLGCRLWTPYDTVCVLPGYINYLPDEHAAVA